MRPAAYVLAIVVLAQAGCNREYEQQACRLTREIAIATTEATPSALAVGRAADGRFAVAWSADGRSALAWVGGDDGAVGIEATVGNAGEEGDVAARHMALAPVGADRMAIAVIEAPGAGREGGAYLGLADERQDAIRLAHLGPAGGFASGIALAVAGGRIVTAWYDGAQTEARLRLAAVDAGSGAIVAATSVDAVAPVSGVALAASGGTLLLAVAEGRSAGRAPRFEVRTAVVRPDLGLGSFVRVASSRFVDPAPTLAATSPGFALAYRDETDDDRLAESFLARLDGAGRPAGSPIPVSRADGTEGPQVVACGPDLVVASIRSFERSLIVGSNRVGPGGAKLGGEFQVYADKSDFTRVALAPQGGGVLMAYVEDRADGGRVLASRVDCAPR
jgi:hypothetical protein